MAANQTLIVGGFGSSSSGGYLAIANNLSDLASAATARTNLGLGTLATQNGTFSGTSSGTNTGDQTNISGNAATVTTNANLTGAVTSTGNATILGSFNTAALNAALSDNDIATLAGTETLTNKTLTAPTVTTLTATGTTSFNVTGASGSTFGNSGNTNAFAIISKSSPTITTYTTSTNSSIQNLGLYTKSTSGTPAAGYGSEINFFADTNGNTDRNQGYLSYRWSTATDASRTSYLEFRVVNNATLIQALDIIPGGINIYGTTSGTITVKGAAAAGTWTLTLPTDDGTSGQVLQTDGNGVTSWQTVSGGGTTISIISGSDSADASGGSVVKKVAVGTSKIILLAGNTNVLTSSDGNSWTTVAHGQGAAHSLVGNTSTGVICLASNSTTTVARRSTDQGATWGNSSGTIAQVGGGLCCNSATNVWLMWDGTTSSSAASRSTDDGANFSSSGMSGWSHAAAVRGVSNDGASGGSAIWIACLNSTSTLKSTDDGLTWAAGGSLPWSASASNYGGGYFLAICTSTSGQFAYSTNGTSWTAKPLPGGIITNASIDYANGYWWVAHVSSSSTALYRTSDITASPIVWTAVPIGFTGSIFVSGGGGISLKYFSGSYYATLNGGANVQPILKIT